MRELEQRAYVAGEAHNEAALFAENPDPRCPVILLLDKSGSMAGAPIRELNAGLQLLQRELQADDLAARRVQLAIVSFGPITTDTAFTDAAAFTAPQLSASGETPMGRAIERALDMLAAQKAVYKAHGISYYRPWVFLITDGGPTDSWAAAAARIRAEEEAKRVAFFAIGTEGADFATLARIAVREPLKLQGLNFSALFQWLSVPLAAVSQSRPGTSVALPTPSGWASV